MKKSLVIPLGIIALIVVGTYALNHFQLQSPMNAVLKGDSRNEGIEVSVHYGYYIDPSTLVYDLRMVSGTNSAADVFRVMLQYAEQIKRKKFTEVAISYKDKVKFKLDGHYFQTIGQEYGTQNPLYTMRTFPEHLKTPLGSPAFGGWTGGWLGVMTKQMEDFGEFHKQWYMSDL